MKLRYVEASVGGLKGYCNEYIVNSEGELLYYSLFGNNEAVDGMNAGILNNKNTQLELHFDYKIEHYIRHNLGMTYKSTKLRNPATDVDNVTHCLTYVPTLFQINEFRQVFTLAGENHCEVMEKAYKILMKTGNVPLMEEWKDIILPVLYVEEHDCFGFGYAASITIPAQEKLEEYMLNHIYELKYAVQPNETLERIAA